MKFFHITGLYKIVGTDGMHSESYHNTNSQNVFTEYNNILNISSEGAKKYIDEENYERVILSGEVNHIQDVFRKNLHGLYKIWKDNYPCNILYTGPDVIFINKCKFSDKFEKFMMFNYTDPKSGYGFDHYFNADVKYYPSTMDENLWNIALNMESVWPEYSDDNNIWNYEQIIWNKMLWDQGLTISEVLKPEYAYQLVSENISVSNGFNNFDIKDTKIIHCMGTRNFYNKKKIINDIINEI